jgi:hypothetical protein
MRRVPYCSFSDLSSTARQCNTGVKRSALAPALLMQGLARSGCWSFLGMITFPGHDWGLRHGRDGTADTTSGHRDGTFTYKYLGEAQKR